MIIVFPCFVMVYNVWNFYDEIGYGFGDVLTVKCRFGDVYMCCETMAYFWNIIGSNIC